MREVVIFNSVTRGAAYGVGTYIRELTHCLQLSGVRVTIVESGIDIAEFRVEETDGVRRLLFPHHTGSEKNHSNRIAAILKLHIPESRNVVFQFNFYSQGTLMSWVKKKFPRAAIIFTVHFFNWSAPLLGDADLYRRIVAGADKKLSAKHKPLIVAHASEKEVFEMADMLVALSDDTASLLADAYEVPREKIFQIANGLRDSSPCARGDKVSLRRQFHIGRDESILLFVGRFDPVKGLDSLLATFKRIVERYDNCRLVLVGDGNTSILKDHSTIISRVIVTGKIDREQVDKWYTIADIGLFPSHYEECSYVGIEMMMHSLPVVSSDGYSVKNMFHDGRNAIVAGRGSIKKGRTFERNLREAISRLVGSEDLREKMAAGARKTYEDVYNIRAMQENYMRLLETMQAPLI